MTTKLTYRLFEGLAGSILVLLGVLLTAKAVPQPLAVNPADLPARDPAATDWQVGMMAQPDQHFIVMMLPHHEDAIAMADLALSRAHHPELKTLAQRIKQTQTQENRQMRAWYQQWFGQSVPTESMGRGRGLIAGRNWQRPSQTGCMSTDLEPLNTAPDFDRTFLETMISHHQMGIRMAEMVLARSDRPEIQTLAQAIIQAQTAEIDQMQYWYQEWYPEGVAVNE